MQQDQPEKNKEKILRAIMIVLLAAIIFISVIFVIINNDQNEDEEVIETFVNKSKEEVLSLLNNSIEYDEVNGESVYNLSKIGLTIIDCRGLEGCSNCQFRAGHLPGAVLNDNYETLFYNVTNNKNDILVYSTNGTVGEYFCQNLTGHVYGKLYNLEGGYDGWMAAGYPIKKGN